MALEGTIKDFGLPDIFQLIGLQRKTGILTLQSDKETVTVTFEAGMVVMADSSAKRLEDRLGSVLVKQGKLSKEKLEEALHTQRATLQRLGHILVSTNAINHKDLKDALQIQVSQIVFKVFRWRDGEYHFAPTEQVDYDRENFTPMSSDFILMEGIRMVDEWPIIEKRIPSMDIVFRTVVDAASIEIGGGDDAVPSAGDIKRGVVASANRIRVTPDEERVFRKIDGNRTVQAVIDATGLAEFDVCRILFDFLNRNMIATAGRGAETDRVPVEGASTPPAPVVGYLGAGVVALVALGLAVAGRSAPFAVTGQPPWLRDAYHEIVDGVSHTRLERLDQAIMAYHLANGVLPRTLNDLVEAALVDARYMKDVAERPFHYALTNNGYLLSAVDDAGKTDPASVIERVVPAERP